MNIKIGKISFLYFYIYFIIKKNIKLWQFKLENTKDQESS